MTRTRYATLLKFKNLKNRTWPVGRPDQIFRIGKKGWWRGMVIHDDIAYVFASDGYRRKKTTAKMAIINLKTGEHNTKNLPFLDNVRWETIYQPNLYEE